LEYVFWRASDDGLGSVDNDGALEEFGVLGDGVEDFVLGAVLVELGGFVFGFLGAEDFLGGGVAGIEDDFELLVCWGLVEVFDDVGFDSAFADELEGLSAFGASWVVVNGGGWHDWGSWFRRVGGCLGILVLGGRC